MRWELGDGGCGLPRALCALAMTWFLQGVWRAAGWGHPALRRVTRGAVGRDDVGSELSAASGRSSEVSEWPRSKFPASAVRQRRNFGHRNRVIGPYESVTRSAVVIGRGDVGIAPYGGETEIHPLRCRKCVQAGRRGRRPLRKRILWCVGEGLCPSHGRGRTPPLRTGTRSAMGGRPQGSPPLRRGYKRCGTAGRCGHRPLRRGTRGAGKMVDL